MKRRQTRTNLNRKEATTQLESARRQLTNLDAMPYHSAWGRRSELVAAIARLEARLAVLTQEGR